MADKCEHGLVGGCGCPECEFAGLPEQYAGATHDKIYLLLVEQLRSQHEFRPTGVKDQLFRLSAYLSYDGPRHVQDETLRFLHAYIFALEHVLYYSQKEVLRLREKVAELEMFKRVATSSADRG